MQSTSSSTIRQNWAECLENVLNDYDALNQFKLWMGADDESSEHPIRLHFAVAAYREMIEHEDVRSLKLARDIYNKFLRPAGGLCAFIQPESREHVRQRLHALLKEDHHPSAVVVAGGGGQPSTKPKQEVPLVVLPKSVANLFEPCVAELDRYLRCQHRIFVSSQEFIDFFNASCGIEDTSAPILPSTSGATKPPQSDPLSASPAKFLSETGFNGGYAITKRGDGICCGGGGGSGLKRSHGNCQDSTSPCTVTTTKLTANSLLRSQRDREVCFNSSVEKMFKPVTKFPYVGGNATTSKNDSAVSSSFSSDANGNQHHGGGGGVGNRGGDSQQQPQRRYGGQQHHQHSSSSTSSRRNNANENGNGARLLPAFPRPPLLASTSADPHHNYSHRSVNNAVVALASAASTQQQHQFRHDTTEGRQEFASLLISKLNSTYNKYKQYKKLDDQLNKIVNKEQPRSIRDVLMSSDMMDDDDEEENDGDAMDDEVVRTSGGGGREADDDVDRYFRRRMCDRTATESGGDVTNNSGSQVQTPPHFGAGNSSGMVLNAAQLPQPFRRTTATGNNRRRSISPDHQAGSVSAAFAAPPPFFGAVSGPMPSGNAALGLLAVNKSANNNFHSHQYFHPQQLSHPQQQQQHHQQQMDYYHGVQQNLLHFVQPTSMPMALMSQSCINSYGIGNTSSGGAMASSMVAQHHHRSCSPSRPYRIAPHNSTAAATHHSHAQFARPPATQQPPVLSTSATAATQQHLFCYGNNSAEPSASVGKTTVDGGLMSSMMQQQSPLLRHSQPIQQPTLAQQQQQQQRTFGFAPPPGSGKSATASFASPYKDIYCDNDCDTSGIGSMTTHFSDTSGAASANVSASTLNKQQKRAAVFRKAREMANAEQQQQSSGGTQQHQQLQQMTGGESFASSTTTSTVAAATQKQPPQPVNASAASSTAQPQPLSSQQKMTISYRSFRRDGGGEPSSLGPQIPIVANVPWNKCLTFREFRRYLSIPSKDRRQFFFKTSCEDGSAPYELLLINDDAAILPIFDGKIAAECRSLSDSE